jgi:hypothetical protein
MAVTCTARKAGAETVAGLTPLARIVNVAGTRASPEPPAGLDAAVPGELPPPEPVDGCALTPPELGTLVCVFGFGLGFCLRFGGAVAVAVLGEVGVLAVLDVAVELVVVAALVVLLACLEPPQPPIASAAINTPESCAKALTLRA